MFSKVKFRLPVMLDVEIIGACGRDEFSLTEARRALSDGDYEKVCSGNPELDGGFDGGITDVIIEEGAFDRAIIIDAEKSRPEAIKIERLESQIHMLRWELEEFKSPSAAPGKRALSPAKA